MNQLSDKDLEFVNKHAHYDVINKQYCFKEEWLTALFAERDAEQQPNAEAVGEAIGTISSYVITNGEAFAEVVLTGIHLADAGTKIFQGMKLFTHAPSQVITPELALKVATDMDNHGFSITVYADNSVSIYTPEALANYVDALLAELKL